MIKITDKPDCYGKMDWILKYPEDKTPKSSICDCDFTNSCLRHTRNMHEPLEISKVSVDYIIGNSDNKNYSDNFRCYEYERKIIELKRSMQRCFEILEQHK